jgi:hypothetical protein
VDAFRKCRVALAVENTNWGKGYLTEKIMNVYLAGAVPVYGGDVQTHAVYNIFNRESMLNIVDYYNETRLYGDGFRFNQVSSHVCVCVCVSATIHSSVALLIPSHLVSSHLISSHLISSPRISSRVISSELISRHVSARPSRCPLFALLGQVDVDSLERAATAIVALANNVTRLREMRKVDIGVNMTDLNLRLRWPDNNGAGFPLEVRLMREAFAAVWPPSVFFSAGAGASPPSDAHTRVPLMNV